MEHFFNISRRHIITAAGNNHYKTPVLHPNRTMPEHDFIYMLEGCWKIRQENEEYMLNAGEVLILEANRPHYGAEPCSVGAKTMFIHAYGLESDVFSDENIRLLSLINTRIDPLVKHYFEKVVYAKLCGENEIASIYFDVLLCELKICMKNEKENTVAERIREFITFTEGIPTNEDIAKHLNISVKNAEQNFKKTFGKTIHQYLLEIKIEKAKQYISDFPNMKLYEIAELLGFYDEFHLSRLFKRLTGASPTEFRIKKQSLT